MSIEIRAVRKAFGAFVALDGIDLSVPEGSLVALLGPSGCGKTTLLRIIAGLELPDSGSILLDARDTTDLRAGARRVGFVFQHYALFRHMTISENVAFGLKVRPRRLRPSREAIRRKVAELLELVQLDRLADRYPSQLSGGQRQRVALSRALAVEPRVLLLDEPFGSLDARVRQELRSWLRRLHDEIRLTSVLVTHDQDEALDVADRIVVMSDGRIEQEGSPEEVYDHPANPFVHDFLGRSNQFRVPVEGGRLRLGDLEDEVPEAERASARSAVVCIRPHLFEIERRARPGEHLQARVLHVNRAGALVRVDLVTDRGEPVRVEISQERQAVLGLERGIQVSLRPRAKKVFFERGDDALTKGLQ